MPVGDAFVAQVDRHRGAARRRQMRTMSRNQFRCNVIDDRGTVSFLAPAHGLKVLAAALSHGADDFQQLMQLARPYDAEWADGVRRDLHVFDEHNVDGVATAFEAAVEAGDERTHRTFRVIDGLTRQRSMEPARLGLVVFNFKEHRIIQIHNNYDDLDRKGRGRVRADGRPTNTLFYYELPAEWAIVP